jgi:ubiquinone/menaquinone biosynthesis C-methylase UbiE
MPAQSHRSDVGCGTGAITSGIAESVGSEGYVVGVDRDAELLATARKEHANIPNLRFELGDAGSLSFDSQFDIVTAARTLQWVSEPSLAIVKMTQAAKRSGTVVVLDYNHARNKWQPDPPAEFQEIYKAFLAWRQANRWDNEIADHLPELFRSTGLSHIDTHVQDEIVERGEQDFRQRSALWSQTIEGLGAHIRDAGFCTESQLRKALEC